MVEAGSDDDSEVEDNTVDSAEEASNVEDI